MKSQKYKRTGNSGLFDEQDTYTTKILWAWRHAD